MGRGHLCNLLPISIQKHPPTHTHTGSKGPQPMVNPLLGGISTMDQEHSD